MAHGPSIHDCAITARFVVVLDLPVTFSLETAMQGRGFPYRWNPEHRARIGLLPRGGRGDETIWIEIDPATSSTPSTPMTCPMAGWCSMP